MDYKMYTFSASEKIMSYIFEKKKGVREITSKGGLPTYMIKNPSLVVILRQDKHCELVGESVNIKSLERKLF